MSEMKAELVGHQNASLGDEIVRRINELGAISETLEHRTRIFLSKEHRLAADLILNWMRSAGMAAHLDAIGNVCGRYEGVRPGLPCLMLGSHYDTVRDAGKWDGPLGLITAISCVADLHRRGRRLPFAIEVAGFADEEGVRFASTLLGSRAIAGTFDESVLNAKDSDGITMRQAMVQFGLDPEHIGAAARARHRIAGLCRAAYRAGSGAGSRASSGRSRDRDRGATRLAANLTGMAGHAGTVPMALRRDALTGAAECITTIEELCRTDDGGLVGTVGYIHAMPGATNVIPGQVAFTIDLRAPTDAHRKRAVTDIVRQIEAVAKGRKLKLQVDVTHENRTVPCAPWLKAAGGGGGRGGRLSRVRIAERGRA